MGRKLYPPYIDGKIPAFCGMTLRVPFRHNPAVSAAQFNKIRCKIKTVSTNEWKWTLDSDKYYRDSQSGNWYVDFDLGARNVMDASNRSYAQCLSVGLFYKIQIGYVDKEDIVGYFSDVGVSKYTAVPNMYIEGLVSGENGHQQNYIGVYDQRGYSADLTEKVYSYSFVMLDHEGNIFAESGEQVHNNSLDVSSDMSKDTFTCNKELQANHKYTLYYSVKTINGLEWSSPIYTIIKKATVAPALNARLHAEMDYDNGYVSLSLINKNNSNEENITSGSFSISRASSLDNFETWNEICQFTLHKETPLRELFKDFTVEQGVRYCYSLQQFNLKGLYSNRMLSETIAADFEDMFLFDGQYQLKIRFDPDVSSFKNDILEQKTDTIGSKYPFIFRNGNVKYKEFSIKGLISHHMDDQHFFIDAINSNTNLEDDLLNNKKRRNLNEEELSLLDYKTTNLTSANIYAERLFKLEVLEWLNNGEAKLFRSPTEGNYFIRLMNVSLSPNKTVGRMLHTFQATAYEINNTDFETLNSANMFQAPSFDSYVMHFMTLDLADSEYCTPLLSSENTPSFTDMNRVVSAAINSENNALDIPYVYKGRFENVAPDSIIALRYNQVDANGRAWTYVTIGRTETYEVNSEQNPIIGVYLVWTPKPNKKFDGLFTFGYYNDILNDAFNEIDNLEYEDLLGQFIGKHNNIIDEDGVIQSSTQDTRSYNYLANTQYHRVAGLQNVKQSVDRFYYLRFQTREVCKMYSKIEDNVLQFYYDQQCHTPYLKRDYLDVNVYADYNQHPVVYYDGRDLARLAQLKWTGSDYAGFDPALLNSANYCWTDTTVEPWTSAEDDTVNVDRLYKFSINHVDNNVDLKEVKRYILTDLDNITSISLGRMLMLDCYYQVTNIDYVLENEWPDDSTEANAQTTYLAAKRNLFDKWAQGKDPEPQGVKDNILSQDFINQRLEDAKQSYLIYCSYVKDALQTRMEE